MFYEKKEIDALPAFQCPYCKNRCSDPEILS
jgi:hypothetical protein